MVVMNMPVKNISSFQNLLESVKSDYPDISFESSEAFRWSDENRTIFYDPQSEYAVWSLLHELGHMISHHQGYSTDTRLVRMEVEAWEKAKELSNKYGQSIDEEYIQDCIDSYRNWQYQRSTCPQCDQTGMEKISGNYTCINCRNQWKVTPNRFCRVYRQSNKKPATI